MDAILVRGKGYKIEGNRESWTVAHKLSRHSFKVGRFLKVLLVLARSSGKVDGKTRLCYCCRLGVSANKLVLQLLICMIAFRL
jgi:hypothetical protein